MLLFHIITFQQSGRARHTTIRKQESRGAAPDPGRCAVIQTMGKRTKFTLGAATALLVIVGLSIAPTIWRYSSYRKARALIESGNQAKAIQTISNLHDSLFFDLDWTIQQSVFTIPHGNRIYERIVGCPSCRGDFNTLLIHAARSGDETLARALINFGASVEHSDDEGFNLLSASIHSGNRGVIDLAISSGANVNNEDPMYPAIHLAVISRQSPEIVDLLLDHGADINMTNNDGWTPLDVACIWSTNAIPELIEHGATLGQHRQRPLLGQGEAVAKRITNLHNKIRISSDSTRSGVVGD